MAIIRPIITEKTLKLAEELNQYTFMVDMDSNKIEVGKEVAKKFNVTVLKVTTERLLGKKSAFGRRRVRGRKAPFKKAVVSLKTGDTIDTFKLK